jgi:CHAT domain-containing protein
VPDADALATRGGPRLVRLPGSRAEIEAVAGKPDDRRLLFADATESGLRRTLEADGTERPWRSIHFACHGLVDVEWPALSCLALTPGDGEDGFLMSNEVLRLPLKTDLAVLSACQTGRGAFVRGEGVMSLTRAFMFAGAPRTIVSLWDVDDQATSFLMQAFYKEWAAGRGTAQALRSAQLAVRDHEVEETIAEPGKPPRRETRRPWSDPKFWAAWALWGLAD